MLRLKVCFLSYSCTFLGPKPSLGILRKERKELEDFKIQYTGRLDKMQASLTKAELDLTVLKSQSSSNKKTLEDLSQQLSPTKDLARQATEQLRLMDESRARVRSGNTSEGDGARGRW